MDTKPRTDVEDRLQYILSSVYEMLEFAETKNAALLAANAGLIFGALTLVNNKATSHDLVVLYLHLASLLLGLAGVCCLVSFIPCLKAPGLVSHGKTSEDDNLVFFADIADYDPRSFLQELCRRSGIEVAGTNQLEEDYAEQIVINSRIAVRKYRCFNAAIWLTVSALISPPGAGLVYLLRRNPGRTVIRE